jgi:hypothetical protein
MGFRKVAVRQSVAESIAAISLYLESEGLLATAEKFSDDVYDFISKLGDSRKRYRVCRDHERQLLGYKCILIRKNILLYFSNLMTK